jgi:hypothetical protein
LLFFPNAGMSQQSYKGNNEMEEMVQSKELSKSTQTIPKEIDISAQ